MSAPERHVASAPSRGSAGPRFALRFEDGRGVLSLSRPLRFAYGTVEQLELSLGALRFPLDLSAGASLRTPAIALPSRPSPPPRPRASRIRLGRL